MKKITFYLMSILIALSGTFFAAHKAYALDPPHNAHDTRFYTVGCSRCHPTRGTTPAWYTAPTPSDNTTLNNLCKDCHKPTGLSGPVYEDVKTHSSYQTSSKYGTWVVECKTCHNPHYQDQASTFSAEGIISTGTVSALLVSAGVSTVTLTNTLSGSYENYDFIPNMAYPTLVYRIKSNSGSTVEVWGQIETSSGFAGPGTTYAIKYGKMVVNQINTPASGTKTVRFFNKEGVNSFATSSTTVDGICQVCHTKTASFKNDGTLEGPGHPSAVAGTKCTTCHEHKTGFKGGGCDGCHGNPPLTNTLGSGGLANNEGGTGSNTAGAHGTHVVTARLSCDACHTGGMPASTIYDKNIQIGFKTTGGGTYDGRTLPLANGYAYSAGNGQTIITNGNNLSCSNVYCHSTVQGANGLGSGTDRPQVWTATGPLSCSACHPDQTTSGTGKHMKHTGAPYSFNCNTCHNSAGAGTTKHVDQSIDLSVSYNGSDSAPGSHAPGQGYGTCSTVYCHSNVQSSTGGALIAGDYKTPKWGDGPLACNGCHGNAPASGSHGASSHTTACTTCHADPATSTHADGAINLVGVGYSGDTTPGNSNFGSCSSTSCHVDAYQPGIVSVPSPTWGNTAGCGACHPINATTGAPDTGSHTVHLTDSASGSGLCGNCHTGAVKDSIGGSGHLDTFITVTNGYPQPIAKHSSASYTGSCSSASCHDNGLGVSAPTRTWGVVVNDCSECHATQPGTGSHTKHLTGLSAGYNRNAVCGDCHSGAVEGTTPPAGHRDGNLDVLNGYPPNVAKGGAPYNSCTAAYCHSSGQSANGSSATPYSYGTPTWGQPVACGSCHPTTVAGGLNTGSHPAHINTVGAQCGACHTGAGNGSSYSSANHVNTTIEVSAVSYTAGGAPGNGYGSCSTNACHGTLSPNWAVSNPTAAQCTKCHGKLTPAASYTLADAAPGAGGTGVDTGQNSTSAKVGAHRAHLEATDGYSIALQCNECHTVPAAFNTDGHLYGGTDITLASAEVPLAGSLTTTNPGGAPGVPGYTFATMQCSNVYCHDSTRFENHYPGGSNHTPAWNDANYIGADKAVNCGRCHGNPPAPGHPAATPNVCNSCHNNVNAAGDAFIDPSKHVNGLVEGGGCDSCHGNPPTTNTYTLSAPSTGLVGTGPNSGDTGATSPISAGAHNRHANGLQLGMSCDACHAGTDMSYQTNGKTIDMGFKIDGTTYPGFIGSASTGTFTGIDPLNSGFTWSATNLGTNLTLTNNYANSNTCAVYCHGASMAPNGGTVSAPSWSDASTAACGSCHGATAANPPTLGSHQKHAGNGGYDRRIACTVCHNNYTADHVNGSASWAFDAATYPALTGALYRSAATGSVSPVPTAPGSYGQCSNLYCHSIVQTATGGALTGLAGEYKTPTWSVGPTGACGSCHDTETSHSAGPIISSGSHTKHMAYTFTISSATSRCALCHKLNPAGAVNNCNACHSNEVNLHVNYQVDIAFEPAFVVSGTYNGTPAPGNGFSNCSTTYCHSDGTSITAIPANITPDWGTTGMVNCGSCHGDSSTLATGSHQKHLAVTGVTCNNCHKATASDNTTVTSYTNHVNRSATLNLNASSAGSLATYNSTSVGGANVYQKGIDTPKGTCNTTICHGSVSPTWALDTNNDTCTKCHGFGTPTGMVDASNRYVVAPPRNTAGLPGVPTGTGQVSDDPKVGAHQTHLQLFNGLTGTTFTTIDERCQYCHGTLPVSGNHANGSSTPAFQGLASRNGLVSSPAPTYVGTTCNNTYCHNPAIATGGTLTTFNTGSNPSPTWTNTNYIADGTLKTTANCGICHKSPWDAGFASTFSHGVMTPATDCSGCHGHNGNGTGAVGQRHMDGIKYGAGNCDSCHGYGPYIGDGKAYRTTDQEGKGAHQKHVSHLIARARVILSNPTFTLDPATDQFGNGDSWTYVCGVCHTNTAHDMSEPIGGTGRTIAIPASYQFGPNAPVYNAAGWIGTSSTAHPKTCSNVSCHFQTTPYWQDPATAGN